jgi:alanine dehydrogenase
VKPTGTLLLRQSEVHDLLSLADCIAIVENAFRLHGEGRSLAPGLLHINSGDGEFHIKAGGLHLEQRYFALKANGSFFHNTEQFGLPNIQGVILLSIGETGYPLAIMDSREITLKRTGAATAVAARHLANPSSNTAVICGAGLQARIQLSALAAVFELKRAFIFSRTFAKAESLANELSTELGFDVEPARELAAALAASQICVTCTPARRFFVRAEDVPPGMFIAAVGADSPGKQEIDPALLRSSKVVTDLTAQAIHVGDLQHAIADGMRPEDIHAELAEIVSGRKTGRTSDSEIIVFDSTGTALQDAAAVVAVYKKALAQSQGSIFNFFA